MLARLFASAVLVAALSQISLAQNPSTYNRNEPAINGQTSPNQADNQNNQDLPQELRKKLTDAGFTDVKVVPSSFFVTAKSKDGQDVMMRISPGSMTMVTDMPPDMTSTTGSGSNSTDLNGSNNSGANTNDGWSSGKQSMPHQEPGQP